MLYALLENLASWCSQILKKVCFNKLPVDKTKEFEFCLAFCNQEDLLKKINWDVLGTCMKRGLHFPSKYLFHHSSSYIIQYPTRCWDKDWCRMKCCWNLIHDKLPILVLLWVSMDKASPVLLPHFGGHTEHWVVWIRSWKANCHLFAVWLLQLHILLAMMCWDLLVNSSG